MKLFVVGMIAIVTSAWGQGSREVYLHSRIPFLRVHSDPSNQQLSLVWRTTILRPLLSLRSGDPVELSVSLSPDPTSETPLPARIERAYVVAANRIFILLTSGAAFLTSEIVSPPEDLQGWTLHVRDEVTPHKTFTWYFLTDSEGTIRWTLRLQPFGGTPGSVESRRWVAHANLVTQDPSHPQLGAVTLQDLQHTMPELPGDLDVARLNSVLAPRLNPSPLGALIPPQPSVGPGDPPRGFTWAVQERQVVFPEYPGFAGLGQLIEESIEETGPLKDQHDRAMRQAFAISDAVDNGPLVAETAAADTRAHLLQTTALASGTLARPPWEDRLLELFSTKNGLVWRVRGTDLPILRLNTRSHQRLDLFVKNSGAPLPMATLALDSGALMVWEPESSVVLLSNPIGPEALVSRLQVHSTRLPAPNTPWLVWYLDPRTASVVYALSMIREGGNWELHEWRPSAQESLSFENMHVMLADNIRKEQLLARFKPFSGHILNPPRLEMTGLFAPFTWTHTHIAVPLERAPQAYERVDVPVSVLLDGNELEANYRAHLVESVRALHPEPLVVETRPVLRRPRSRDAEMHEIPGQAGVFLARTNNGRAALVREKDKQEDRDGNPAADPSLELWDAQGDYVVIRELRPARTENTVPTTFNPLYGMLGLDRIAPLAPGALSPVRIRGHLATWEENGVTVTVSLSGEASCREIFSGG